MPRSSIPIRRAGTGVPARKEHVDPAPRAETTVRERVPEPSEEMWRDRALRLQAEMDNFRKRQRRVARDEAQEERDRLLMDVLAVADNLDRTLAADEADTPLRRGVAMTLDGVLQLLKQYDVERIEAVGQPFDPHLHEAVGVVPVATPNVEPGTIAEVMQSGYRRRGQLFRPARVMVTY